MTAGFLEALAATGPASDWVEAMRLYGRFIGTWDLDVTHVLEDGRLRRRPGRWHFGWVLQGRAIQDVWILPARPGEAEPECYGTTLRAWDPAIGGWRIHYADPATGSWVSQTGRAEGPDIVQLGTDPDGTRRRWRFTDITPGRFRWRGEVACVGPEGEGPEREGPEGEGAAGEGWHCHTDFIALRRGDMRG